MPDEHSYHRRLLVAEPIHRPIVLEAIAALDLTNGSSGLDAGCGIGLQCHALACAVGDGGHVTGVDVSPDLLGVAEERAKRAGLSERISLTPLAMFAACRSQIVRSTGSGAPTVWAMPRLATLLS